MNPIGPEEPSVYWRRRAIAGVIVLVAIWVLWMALGAITGRGSNASAVEPSQSPSFGLSLDSASPQDGATDDPSATPSGSAGSQEASASATPTGDASGSTSPSASESASASESTSASASASSLADGSCGAASLTIGAKAASASVAVGSGTVFTMSVTNNGTGACTRDVGPGANELRLTSGGTIAWSSDHCNPSTASKSVTLQPGQSWSTTLTWNGQRSKAGCGTAGVAPAGTYTLTAYNGAQASEPVTVTVK